MSTTEYPRRPRMMAPYVYGAIAAMYLAIAIYYFLADKPLYGVIWLACVPMWVWSAMRWVKTHRLRVETWELRCRTIDRIREFDERYARLMRPQADQS